MQRDLSSPLPWRRSLRASQERRLERARQEQRRKQERREGRERAGRRGLVAAVCGLAVMAGGAFAHDGGAPDRRASTSASLERGDRGGGVRDLQRALGVGVDGVYGPKTVRAVRSFQRKNGLTVDGVAGPITLRELGLGRGTGEADQGSSSGDEGSSGDEQGSTDAGGGSSAGNSAELQTIAQCESGGNPAAVSPSGRYRGKYQFSRETWRNMGGEGDPAAASEAEQDRRAAALYEQSGGSAWPNCAG